VGIDADTVDRGGWRLSKLVGPFSADPQIGGRGGQCEGWANRVNLWTRWQGSRIHHQPEFSSAGALDLFGVVHGSFRVRSAAWRTDAVRQGRMLPGQYRWRRMPNLTMNLLEQGYKSDL